MSQESSMKRVLGVFFLFATVFALIGALFGAGLGAFAPDYYRAVFHMGGARDFNPIQTGIGLGVTQGFAVGILIAIGSFGLQSWRKLSAINVTRSEYTFTNSTPGTWWIRWAIWSVITLVLVTVFSSAAFLLGAVVGTQQVYRSFTDRKLLALEKVLESGEFPGVRSTYSSAAQVYLVGSVSSEQARSTLYNKLILAFGTDEANNVIRIVDIKPK